MTFRFYRNDEFRIVPFTDDDFEIIKKMEVGEVHESDIKKMRNPGFHRKFFLLMKKGFENTKTKITNLDFYRKYITMKAGYYESIDTGSGIMILPMSISFENMDQITFEKLYSESFDQVIIDIECDEEMFKNELQSFM